MYRQLPFVFAGIANIFLKTGHYRDQHIGIKHKALQNVTAIRRKEAT